MTDKMFRFLVSIWEIWPFNRPKESTFRLEIAQDESWYDWQITDGKSDAESPPPQQGLAEWRHQGSECATRYVICIASLYTRVVVEQAGVKKCMVQFLLIE